MYRITSNALATSIFLPRHRFLAVLRLACLFLIPALAALAPLHAQTGGEAGIQGTVTDSTGAAIPNATVTATNAATGVATTRQTTGTASTPSPPSCPAPTPWRSPRTGFSNHHPEEPHRRRARPHPAQRHPNVGDARAPRSPSTRLRRSSKPPTPPSASPSKTTTYANLPAADEQRPARSHRLRHTRPRRSGRRPPAHHRRHRQLPRPALSRRPARRNHQPAGRQPPRLPGASSSTPSTSSRSSPAPRPPSTPAPAPKTSP